MIGTTVGVIVLVRHRSLSLAALLVFEHCADFTREKIHKLCLFSYIFPMRLIATGLIAPQHWRT